MNMEIIKSILALAIPAILELVKSNAVPFFKRRMYERINYRIDKLIEDLAQNAQKITKEENAVKKAAYIEGTKLGLDTIRLLAEKLNKAADEIEKVVVE